MNEGKQSKIEFSVRDYIAKALPRVARVEHQGVEKYGRDNWYKVSQTDDIEHAIRHLICALNDDLADGNDDHLAHAACRVLMAIAFEEFVIKTGGGK